MKVRYIYIALVALLGGIFWGCSDWTEVESKDFFTPPSDSYYEALREYKKSDHEISFGWFGNWTGVGASLVNCMRGIPDSVDVISIWGNWRNLTEDQKKDLKYIQEVKGTKALMCFIIANIGDQLTPEEVRTNYEANGFNSETEAVKAYWGWDDNNPESINSAIIKYANCICDTIDKYNYDGFDIDYEPNYGAAGNMSSYNERMFLFIKTLRERLGTREETGKLIVVDGEPQTIASEAGKYLDYFIVQAYQCYGDANLDSRLRSTINNFEGHLSPQEVAKKYVVTENFESYAQDGGVAFTDRYGNKMQSLEGMARWTPIIDGEKVRKGGVGTYHMEYDYPFTPEYKWLRAAIQIMNPSVK
ncbi:glycoside hydrolase family 18 [Bacteroides thetaiotaomicron]|uniref:glycoside hydrolase family 18 n=1 Tax=Bacteroides thetaiotaomicron TaxID=818 RepID=UPI0039B5BB72